MAVRAEPNHQQVPNEMFVALRWRIGAGSGDLPRDESIRQINEKELPQILRIAQSVTRLTVRLTTEGPSVFPAVPSRGLRRALSVLRLEVIDYDPPREIKGPCMWDSFADALMTCKGQHRGFPLA